MKSGIWIAVECMIRLAVHTNITGGGVEVHFIFRMKWSNMLAVCSGAGRLNFGLASHMVDADRSTQGTAACGEQCTSSPPSATRAPSSSEQANVEMCWCQADGGTKSNKGIHKTNFHPIFLAAACLRFAKVVVNSHPENSHYFCKPKQMILLGESQVKPSLQECLISPAKGNCFIWSHQGRPLLGQVQLEEQS